MCSIIQHGCDASTRVRQPIGIVPWLAPERHSNLDTGYEDSYPVVVDLLPDGPRRVGQRHQITLPSDQLETIGVGPGDEVWIALNPDRPKSLVILSGEDVAEIFRKGWTAVGGS